MGANYGVSYVRPAKSLLRLRDELNAVFPGRFTGTDGFITGYDSQRNPRWGSSGHNPNSLGHVMAFDISTPANGQQIDEATGRALADYLRTQVNVKFKYLIHDQGPAAPEPRIAGDFSAWDWQVYTGPAAHSDHIHISITDDYLWGDNCGCPQEVYDDESSWGIAEWYASYTGSAPLSTSKPVVVLPAPAPAAPPAAPPAPAAAAPVNRTVTNPVAYARTEPRSYAPVAVEVAQGAPLAVIGYVGGEDPYGTGDNAWYKTKSGYYVWANAASNDISGLPFLGNM